MTHIVSQATNLMKGMQRGMALGEGPQDTVSTGFQMSVSSALVTASNNLELITPATLSQQQYESIPPKLTLGPDGVSSCYPDQEYVQLSALQWANNPYPNSQSVQSSLFELSLSSQVDSSSSISKSAGDVTPYTRRTAEDTSIPHKSSGPAFTLVLQYSSRQNTNSTRSAGEKAAGEKRLNVTVPDCTLFNGAEYVACESCNISSYTDFNATFHCYDITLLCPTSTSTRSNIKGLGGGVDRGSIGDECSGSDCNGQYDDTPIEPTTESDRDRELGANDDTTTSTGTSPSVSFGVVFHGVISVLSDILSTNPFALDTAGSVVVLSFMGSFVGFLLILLACFLRTDSLEKLHKRYVMKESEALARKLFEEEIKQGGKGDISGSYRAHLTKIEQDRSKRSVMFTFIRSPTTALHLVGLKASGRSLQEKTPDESAHDVYKTDCSARFQVTDCPSSSLSSETPSEGQGASQEQHEKTVVVAEFLHNLFPGQSMFTKKRNAVDIISANHDYSRMFAPSLIRSRTVRFIRSTTYLLTCVFIDTIFFSLYYPSNSSCHYMVDKVWNGWSWVRSYYHG
jgi:hypothetical protein